MDYAPPLPPPYPPEDSERGQTRFDIASLQTANLPPLYDGHSGQLTPYIDMPTVSLLARDHLAAITDQRGRRISQHEQLALELQARLDDIQAALTSQGIAAGELSREQYDLVAIMLPTLEQITRIRQLDAALHSKMSIIQTLRLHWQRTARDLEAHLQAAHNLRATTTTPPHTETGGHA